MAIKTKIVETAALSAFQIVKKGTAEKGVVIGTYGADALGVVVANDFNESFAVDENVGIAMSGECARVLVAATIADGGNIGVGTIGAIPISTNTGKHYRLGRALENGNPGEAIELIVTDDYVTVP